MFIFNVVCFLYFWILILGMFFNICLMFIFCFLKFIKKLRNFCYFILDVCFFLGLIFCDLFLIYKGFNIIVYNIRDKNLKRLYFSFWIW